MVEIERNPMAVRQGAAAVACMAAAAVAMPVIAHRAAEQRDGAAEATTVAYQTQVGADLFARAEPSAQLQLVVARGNDGLRARGSAPLVSDGADTHAMLVQAALRGPLADAAHEAPSSAINQRELNCLSQAVYYEARGESYRGQVAVAEVVMNRTRSGLYPGSICGVVYQGSHRATGCQFTFTCDGSLNRRPRGAAWARSQQVARQVMLGYTRPITARATHYHTAAVDPYWSSSLIETGRVGDHVFYRFPNRAERARLVEAGLIRRAPRGVQADVALPGYEDAYDDGRVDGVIAADVTETNEKPEADVAAPELVTTTVTTPAAPHAPIPNTPAPITTVRAASEIST